MIKRLYIAAAITLWLAISPAAGAEFSAEMVVTGPHGTFSSSIFVKGDWQRHEQAGQIVIFNTKTGKTYTLMEDEKAYLEMGDDQEGDDDRPKDMGIGQVLKDDTGETERLPSETLWGYTCHRYRHIPSEEAFGRSDMWYSPDLEAAIKVISDTPLGKITMEYRDIVEKPQDPELFFVPEGYKRIDLDF